MTSVTRASRYVLELTLLLLYRRGVMSNSSIQVPLEFNALLNSLIERRKDILVFTNIIVRLLAALRVRFSCVSNAFK
jgi:hypothetical protein